MLRSENIFLRSVETSDATKLMLWENNPAHWKVTDTEIPFSMSSIFQLIEQQQQFRTSGQLRLMICLTTSEEAIGAIDLYDADFKNGNAAVGILVGEFTERQKGYARESLNLLIEYATEVLALHNLHCSIQADNKESIRLFEGVGFQKIGIRKEWFLFRGQRIDEISYQLCLKK
jgi:diamine N-acetyltransferase